MGDDVGGIRFNGDGVVYVDVTFSLVFSWDIYYCFAYGCKWDVCGKGNRLGYKVLLW